MQKQTRKRKKCKGRINYVSEKKTLFDSLNEI